MPPWLRAGAWSSATSEPDAPVRRGREIKALRLLAGRFPVPPLIEYDDSQVVLAFVAGVPGQEILEERPGEVLFEVGRAGPHCMS